MKTSDLATSDKWWNVPTFVTLPKVQWPTDPDTGLLEESVVREMKAEFKKEDQPASLNLAAAANTGLTKCSGLEQFSSSIRLLRVTGYVVRFIASLKKKVKSTLANQKSLDESLTVPELGDVDVLLLCHKM